MSNRKLVFVVAGVLLLACAAAAVAAEVDYFGYQEWGGSWSDAEKQNSRWSECSLLCWAATASNQIQYTGWTPNTSLDNADEIFRYFQDSWNNQGGWMKYGWNWWFNGVNPPQGDYMYAQVTDPNSGNFYSQYNYANFWNEADYQGTTNLMVSIDQNLHAGNGVGLWISGPSSHAISCWGVRVDTAYSPTDYEHYYKGIWITDSDDAYYQEPAPDNLYYTEVEWTGSVVWALPNYRFGGYALNGTQSLERPVTHFNNVTGSWGTTGNWDNALPDTFLETYVDAGTAQIGANVTVGKVYIGFKGTGVVTHSQGIFTATEMHLGAKAGSNGKYEIGGTGTFNVTSLYVGEAGTGRFNVTNSAANVNISKLLQFGTTAANYAAVAGTTLTFANDTAFKNAARITANVSGLAETTFLFNGTGNSSINFFEVAGQDFGAVVSGFTDNFHIKALTIGGSGAATLKLVNDYVNYNGTPPGTYSEALYIHTLTVNSGSTFNLNNYHVYVGTLNNYGTILNGTVTVVAGGQGNGPEMIPEPAAILMLMPAFTGIAFFIRRRR